MASQKDSSETNISGEDYLSELLQKDTISYPEFIEFVREKGYYNGKEPNVLFVGKGVPLYLDE